MGRESQTLTVLRELSHSHADIRVDPRGGTASDRRRTDVDTYLRQQRQILNKGLADLSRLAAAGDLNDVELTGAGFTVTPHKALFPDIAKSLKAKIESRLPAIRITDLLLEVDARTGFSNAFSHLCSCRAADNKLALLTAILADGINLGLTRMAAVSPGITMRQLVWAHD